jgi:hypothetical protein
VYRETTIETAPRRDCDTPEQHAERMRAVARAVHPGLWARLDDSERADVEVERHRRARARTLAEATR